MAAIKDNRLSDPFAQPKGTFPLLISVQLIFLDHCSDMPVSSACHDAIERDSLVELLNIGNVWCRPNGSDYLY